MGLVAGMLEGTLKVDSKVVRRVCWPPWDRRASTTSRRAPLSVSLLKYMDTTFSCPSGDAASSLPSEAQRPRVEISIHPSGPTPAGWRAWYVIKLPDL